MAKKKAVARRVFSREELKLTHLQIRNLKSVSSTELELSPLTVLIGANSSGKSSALQSLMLVAQNCTSAQGFEWVLNGPAVNFGQFRHLVKRGSSGETSISVRFSGQDRLRRNKYNVEAKHLLTAGDYDEKTSRARLSRYELKVSSDSGLERFSVMSTPNLEYSTPNSYVSDLRIRFPINSDNSDSENSILRSSKHLGRTSSRGISGFLPSSLIGETPLWRIITDTYDLSKGRGRLFRPLQKEDDSEQHVLHSTTKQHGAIPSNFLRILRGLKPKLDEIGANQPLVFDDDVFSIVMRELAPKKNQEINLPELISEARKIKEFSWLNDSVKVSIGGLFTNSAIEKLEGRWRQFVSQDRDINYFSAIRCII